MTRWDPKIDLARLLDALAREILAASDDEVRFGNLVARRAIGASADEVRRVVDAVLGDGAEAADVDASLSRAAFLGEHRVRQH